MYKELKALLTEYENSVLVQNDIIAINRTRLCGAVAARNRAEEKRLRTLLSVLYDEKRDLLQTIEELKEYCDDNNSDFVAEESA